MPISHSDSRVFVSAGEASGDAYAGALVLAMKARLGSKQVLFEGLGSRRSRAAGVDLLADSARWGAIGVFQALAVGPRIFFSYYRLKWRLRTGTPGLFIAIDFGYGNIKLARHAHNQGWNVLYFMPPGSWRKDRQATNLASIVDAVVTQFPWSEQMLKASGINVHWFGHPIKQLVSLRAKEVGDTGPRETLAILPGSRSHEIEANLPLIAEALKGFDVPAEFALAPSLSLEEVENKWKKLSGRSDKFTPEDTVGVLLRARAGLICSGTATLEAVLCRCPMVVFYEFTPAQRREAALLRIKRPKYIALPNILLDRFVVNEHVERHGIDPGVIRAELEEIWKDTRDRADQIEAFEEIDSLLGASDAIERTADLAVSMLSS